MSSLSSMLFLALWLLTFPLAWYLLLQIALSQVSKKYPRKVIKVCLLAAVYVLVILLPLAPTIINDGPNLLSLSLATIMLIFAFFGARKLSSTGLIDKLWDNYSHVYDALNNFYPYSELLKEVTSELPSNDMSDGQIIELGAGTGNLIQYIRIHRKDIKSRLVGVEFSESMHRIGASKATQLNNVLMVKQDALLYLKGQPDNCADAIVMNNFIYTQSQQRRLEIIRETSRLLKDRGVIVVSNPDRKGSWPLIKHSIQNDGIASLLKLRLVQVFIYDWLISQISDTEIFEFSDYKTLKSDYLKLGLNIEGVKRTYGGELNGVNILFVVRNYSNEA